MEQKDYLERQISQLGKALAKLVSDLLGIKDKVNSNAIEITNFVLKGKLDIDLERILSIENENFVTFLINEKQFNDFDLERLSEVFLLVIDNKNDVGKQKRLYGKSLLILEYLQNKDIVFSLERNLKINDIKLEISKLESIQ